MDMLKYRKLAAAGDTAVIYVDAKSKYSIVLQTNGVSQTVYGALKHDDVIGSEYGSRFRCSRGYVYVLFITPEMWTITLPHRTQILYLSDISLIVFQLDLKPGSVVCEAGTGSGSLTHAIARTVAPNGSVHTFDFHNQRVAVAKEEFQQHGLHHIIHVKEQDVLTVGFGSLRNVDAVVLDLPRPWDAIGFTVDTLRPGGRICCFSPCIEQVQKTHESLRRCGFTGITTMECLLRRHNVKKVALPMLNVPEVETACIDVTEAVKVGTKRQLIEKEQSDVPTCSDEPEMMVIDTQKSSAKRTLTTSNMYVYDALPPLQMPTHTGYLTFASLYW